MQGVLRIPCRPWRKGRNFTAACQSLFIGKSYLFLESYAKGTLLGQGITCFLSESPVDLGTEEEEEVDDEPDDRQHVVVPEEHASIENTAEEVVAGN